MRKILTIILLAILSQMANAHPGIGIVKDSKGNIFYTDLKQVWKISVEGNRTVVVPNVHTHELYMDASDNLYGEHLWYNGDQTKTWGHYVWCLHANGDLEEVVKPTEGFLDNYSFVRDGLGNMYWAERFTSARIKKKSVDGTITTIAEGKFKNIRWMYATSSGVLYFIDLVDLYKIEPGQEPKLIAEEIGTTTNLLGPITNAQHYLAGIWTDKEENVYVANYTGQEVKKFGVDGMVSKAAYSVAPWAPTGGLFDDKGNLWLMENSVTNQVRVRMIPLNELGKEKNAVIRQLKNNVLPPVLLIGVVVVTIILIAFAAKIVIPRTVNPPAH